MSVTHLTHSTFKRKGTRYHMVIISCKSKHITEVVEHVLMCALYGSFWRGLCQLIVGLRPANERQCYFVTTPLIGWAQTSKSAPNNFTLVIMRVNERCLIVILKSGIWITSYCLGLSHEIMVCAVCIAIFLWTQRVLVTEYNTMNLHQVWVTQWYFIWEYLAIICIISFNLTWTQTWKSISVHFW